MTRNEAENVAQQFSKGQEFTFSIGAASSRLRPAMQLLRITPEVAGFTEAQGSIALDGACFDGQSNTLQNRTRCNIEKGHGCLKGSNAPNFDQPGGGHRYHVPNLDSL